MVFHVIDRCGQLHFIEEKMDRHMCLNILNRNFKSNAEKLELQRTFKFYQDNDPKHASYLV